MTPRVGLVIENPDGIGGLEIAAFRHARLLEKDVNVVPIALANGGPESDWAGRVEETTLGGRPGFRIRASDFRVDSLTRSFDLRHHAHQENLIRIARRERLDVLHVFGAFEMRPLIAAGAAVECGLPLILSFRGVDLDVRVLGEALPVLQAATRAARLCVCLNARAERRLRGLLGYTGPVRVVPNSIDPAAFDPVEPLELPLPRPVIGCLGEFRRVLGLDFLLRAFEEIVSRREASLLLVGPFRPSEAPYYAPLLDSLPSARRILRAGRVPHARVLSWMSACDVMAFPSVSDASPNKVLEAMLAGRPIVAADVGGIPELIRDGIDGDLVDCRDPGRLAAALEALLDDPDRRARCGASARARALSEFPPEREREAWLECYREVGLC